MKRKIPYKGTTINWSRTQGQVQVLMEKYGVKSFRWTSGIMGNTLIVRFEFIYEKNGFPIPCRIEVPIPNENEKERSRLMRVFFWYLKTKMETVEAGFREFEEEFLSYIVNKDGKTVYELVSPGLKQLPSKQ